MSDTGNRRRVGMSFRIRLMVFTAVAIAVTVTGASLAVWIVSEHQLRGQVDSALAVRAQAVAQGNLSNRGPFGLEPGTAQQLIPADGDAPPGAFLPISAHVRRVAAGESRSFFSDEHVEIDDQHLHVRVFTAPLPGGGAVMVARNLAETDKALHRIGLVLIVVGGAGVALAAALAAFVAAAALRPIRRLTAAAEQVTATGNLTERVEVERGDELGRLAGRFNAMLAALEKSVGAQRRLVADASHELRTPLTAARTNVDLIREGSLPEDEARRAASEASVELDALTRLVSDLVELARGEERKLRVEDVQLDDLVASVVERAQARAPQVTFVTALSHSMVRADVVLLERAVSNLLDNAVKYSPDGAPIEVSVRGGEVVVTDHGPGISETDLPRVFDRFYRAASARSKPGAGLGLAIVREAAEAHGGRATAESTTAGARFRLTLPVTP
ncbi:MAG TPA: HAMP domain-containing sensor histidine kinase [Gaiellaceae bacterium]